MIVNDNERILLDQYYTKLTFVWHLRVKYDFVIPYFVN